MEVTLELNTVEDSGTPMLQVLVEREEVIERPDIVLVDPTDIFVPVKAGPDPNEMPHFTQRLWWDEDRLRQEVMKGRLYKDAVEELLDSGPPRGDQPAMDSGGYRASVDATEGVEGYGPSNVRRLQFEILEHYRSYDIDHDGLNEEIIVWLSPHARGRVLGWDYLDNVYAHGRRPYRVGRFFPIPFRFLGLPFAEIVRGIQEEVNAIHNTRVDYATLQNLPYFFYRSSSTLNPTTTKLVPGQGVPTDNPQQDVLFPKWQGDQAWGQQEEAVLMQHFERLSGLTDLSIGRQPNRVGATRTAAGTQTLLSEAGLRFKGAMKAFQQLWVGVFTDILALDQEYLPPDKEFRVTGRTPTSIRIADRTAIRGSYEIRLVATNETMNRQKQREDAVAVLQALLNPVPMQGGLVGTKAVRRGLQKFLKAYGEDPDFYLEPIAPILDPEEELAMMAAGQDVSPVQGENLQLHISTHMLQAADPGISADVKTRLQAHIQKTYQLLMQMQMAMAAQQGAGTQATLQPPQQSMNAATGGAAPQAPAGQTSPQAGVPSQ